MKIIIKKLFKTKKKFFTYLELILNVYSSIIKFYIINK